MWMPKYTYIELAQTPLDTRQNGSLPSEGWSYETRVQKVINNSITFLQEVSILSLVSGHKHHVFSRTQFQEKKWEIKPLLESLILQFL